MRSTAAREIFSRRMRVGACGWGGIGVADMSDDVKSEEETSLQLGEEL